MLNVIEADGDEVSRAARRRAQPRALRNDRETPDIEPTQRAQALLREECRRESSQMRSDREVDHRRRDPRTLFPARPCLTSFMNLLAWVQSRACRPPAGRESRQISSAYTAASLRTTMPNVCSAGPSSKPWPVLPHLDRRLAQNTQEERRTAACSTLPC